MSCNCQKKASEQNSLKEISSQVFPIIEYNANSRGFYQKTTFENNKIYFSKNRDDKSNGEMIKTPNDDLTELMMLYKNIDLEKLSSYKDPTQARFYDGAAIATLKIIVEGKEYETVAFDHGNPPIEIEKFVNKIVALGTIKQ